MQNYENVADEQFGFCSKRATADAITELTEIIRLFVAIKIQRLVQCLELQKLSTLLTMEFW